MEILKGMKDRIGLEALKMQYLFDISTKIFENYGYTKIFTPILEQVELFKRAVGDETDVVSKEMYEFIDKGGRNITLRPEGSASVVRAYLEEGYHKSNPNQKFYYQGSMYRYEAPQKGRLREFFQIGVENFGTRNPLVDAEIIIMGIDFLNEIGIVDTKVEINNIGNLEERIFYLENLKKYLEKYRENLSEDSKKRLTNNPLRILDSKDKNDIDIIKNAPKLYEYLTEENKKYFNDVLKILEENNIDYVVNYNLVRGLDYYSSTVFEIKSSKLGAQSTILGGGRYDRLLEIMGNISIPAIGFAAGVERLMLLIDDEKIKEYIEKENKYYAIYTENTREYMFSNVRKLRNKGIKIEYDYSTKSFSNQMKKADKLGYKKVLIFGEEEMKNNKILYKNFDEKIQKEISIEELN